MFARSAINEDDNNQNYLSTFVEGKEVTVRKTASNSPSRLELRIAEGEDVIAIWFGWENQDDLKSVSQRIGYNILTGLNANCAYSLRSIHQMDKHEILEFCRTINVHPAHLMPLKSTPEFSLPAPLLELLIDMIKGKVPSDAEDTELAKVAVEFERKRINQLLYDKSRQEKLQTPENQNQQLSLMQVFSDVLDSPVLMKKLAQESIGVSIVFQDKAYIHYPLAMRVRNVALYSLQDKITSLRKWQKNKENLLDTALENVEAEYTGVFNSKTSHSLMLSFIGQIKDVLLSRDIEPKAATIEDIVGALKGFDFNGSQLKKAYDYFGSTYGKVAAFEELKQDFLTDLAESVALYFVSEDRLSKAKRRSSREISELPLQEDIEKPFKDESFKEGKLFRRLMDNRVIIALAFYDFSVQPSVEPK